MALFGFSKDKHGNGSNELVLAYLEEAAKVRSAFCLLDPRKHEFCGTILSVNESGGAFTVQVLGSLVADKGATLSFSLIHDSLRLGAEARLVLAKSGSVELELPERLELRERRKTPRARLNPREGATVTALTGLFDGVGITGVIENLSEGGVRVRVEKAMAIQGEKKLPLNAGLIPAGSALTILKLNKLPKAPPVLELGGRVAYEDTASGLCLGIAFTALPPEAANAIRNLVGSRAQALPSTLPPKVRRQPEPREEEPSPRRPERISAAPAPEPRKPAPLPPPPNLPSPVSAEPQPVEPPAAPRITPLLRLKKRARTVVIASQEGAVRELLTAHLLEEGYGKVVATGTLTELLEALQQMNVGLILLDRGVAEMEGLDLVSLLSRVQTDLPPIVLAAEEVNTVMVLEARRVGVAQLLVKPYALDDAFSELLEAQMGLN